MSALASALTLAVPMAMASVQVVVVVLVPVLAFASAWVTRQWVHPRQWVMWILAQTQVQVQVQVQAQTQTQTQSQTRTQTQARAWCWRWERRQAKERHRRQTPRWRPGAKRHLLGQVPRRASILRALTMTTCTASLRILRFHTVTGNPLIRKRCWRERWDGTDMSIHRKKDARAAASDAAARAHLDQKRPAGAGPIGRTVPTMPPLAQTRVGKCMQPGRAGTVKLHHRFGAALLLVRYRYHWTGLYRYTTVELLVDAAPVTRGQSLSALHAVRLGHNERALMAEARHRGARWNPMLLCWTLPGHLVQTLDLGHRVESTPHSRRRTDKVKRQQPDRSEDIPTRGHL